MIVKKIEEDYIICKFKDKDGEFTCKFPLELIPDGIRRPGEAVRFGYKEEDGCIKPDISLREAPYNKKLAKEIKDLSDYLGKIK